MNTPDPARVETPVGYVDLERASANARRIAEYARAHGFAWRPHIKTHKSRRIAGIQLDAIWPLYVQEFGWPAGAR